MSARPTPKRSATRGERRRDRLELESPSEVPRRREHGQHHPPLETLPPPPARFTPSPLGPGRAPPRPRFPGRTPGRSGLVPILFTARPLGPGTPPGVQALPRGRVPSPRRGACGNPARAPATPLLAVQPVAAAGSDPSSRPPAAVRKTVAQTRSEGSGRPARVSPNILAAIRPLDRQSRESSRANAGAFLLPAQKPRDPGGDPVICEASRRSGQCPGSAHKDAPAPLAGRTEGHEESGL